MVSRGVRFPALHLVGATLLFAVGATPPLLAQRVAEANDTERSSPDERRVSVDVDNTPLRTVLELIGRQAGLSASYDNALIPSSVRITMHVRNVPVMDALEHALDRTGLVAQIGKTGTFIVTRGMTAAIMSGGISGHVRDAATKQPLRGVRIALDDTTHRALTRDDGAYRFTGVTPGAHRITMKLVGYTAYTRSVTVAEGETLVVDGTLTASTNQLEQVVVTGTVIPTELKAVSSAITVITAKDIEQRGITKIDQLFRGDVPGVFESNRGADAKFDQVTMYSRGATAFSSGYDLSGINYFNSDFNNSNAIKTYVDGVELADPKFLSQIDPRNIERIEILTGPQASTVYGSGAINGVMQVFTKRGATTTPQLTLNLQSGFVQNNFSSARTPQHDYSGQLSGVEGRLSYNGGGSWVYMGPWSPSKQSARTSAFGGTRLEIPTSAGRVTADVTLRRQLSQTRQTGTDEQTTTGYEETGWYQPRNNMGLTRPTVWNLTGQTLGVTLSYTPFQWWSHELTWGDDGSDTQERNTAVGHQDVGDTSLFAVWTQEHKRSLRYFTTLQVPITSWLKGTFTGGVDGSQTLASTTVVYSTLSFNGSLNNSHVWRSPAHNTGAFIQPQLAIGDRLFLTYGLRAEWNPNFGANQLPNYAPKYGIAYTQDFGPVTAKLRASYGSSTKPPGPKQKSGFQVDQQYPYLVPYYGDFYYLVPNQDLTPEYQQGGEGGLELYLGSRASLVVTRYNQTVNGLIDSPVIDSVRSSVVCVNVGSCFGYSYTPDGYGYVYQYQYLNLGSIRNQGWELQGTTNVGPFTAKGTYSWTKSRTIGITPKYRSLFSAQNYPQYQPGATFLWLPEHTWALGLTYNVARTTISLNLNGTGTLLNDRNDFFMRNLSSDDIRLQQNMYRQRAVNGYVSFNPAYTTADLNATRQLTEAIQGVMQIQNLGNFYENDKSARYPTMGRQVKSGLRIRL